jgi:hypothetical protein
MADKTFMVQMKPEHALTICSFLMEFEPDLKNDHQFTLLKESIGAFKESVFNMSNELFEDGQAAVQVKALIGEAPPMRGNLRIRE